jgi:hypothetical protein
LRAGRHDRENGAMDRRAFVSFYARYLARGERAGVKPTEQEAARTLLRRILSALGNKPGNTRN